MKRERGFSLVELMVAVTLALIVTSGVLSVFVGSRSAFQSTSGVAALTDGGRFALTFIQQSVRVAGYMACNNAQRQLSILNPGVTPLYYSFSQALGGFEASNTGVGDSYTVTGAPVAPDALLTDWTSGLDPALANQVIQNSDILVVRSTLAPTQAVYVTAIADGASNFTVNSSRGLATRQLAVISDCAKSAVLQISSVTPSGSGAVIDHSSGGGPPGNSVSALPVSFGVGSQVTAVNTTAFYIGRGADGDGALFAYDLNASSTFTARELVPDIEAMQVLFGIDTNGTQTASEYVTADQVADFNTVMSIKVAVLAASPANSVKPPPTAPTYDLLGTSVTAPIDTRTRKVFDVTIAVRNSVN